MRCWKEKNSSNSNRIKRNVGFHSTTEALFKVLFFSLFLCQMHSILSFTALSTIYRSIKPWKSWNIIECARIFFFFFMDSNRILKLGCIELRFIRWYELASIDDDVQCSTQCSIGNGRAGSQRVEYYQAIISIDSGM